MECPYCGKTDSEVIDSRLAKDGVTIRRRRQCLICSSRFTTYESTKEQLLPFLITKNAGPGATIPNVKTMLSLMSRTLKTILEETQKLINKIEKREKAQALKASKKKARERRIARRKVKSLMMTETVFKRLSRDIKGVLISQN